MNIPISKSNTLLSGTDERNNSLYKSISNHPDLSSLMVDYHSDYDEHSWILAWIMRYLW